MESSKILFIQTADPGEYFRMLVHTSKTVRLYCAEQGFDYRAFVGIRRGHLNWHAAYNRIYMLRDLVREGRSGWVVYLDADAYIQHFDFDLRGHLEARQHLAAILFHTRLPQDKEWYWINDGMFFINLASPVARDLIDQWARAFDNVTDEQLARSAVWGQDFDDDQNMLVRILASSEHYRNHIEHATDDIRRLCTQYLRAYESDLSKRIEVIEEKVAKVLNRRMVPPDGLTLAPLAVNHALTPSQFVRILYRGLLGREPDTAGLEAYSKSLQLNAGTDFESYVDIVKIIVGGAEFRNSMGSAGPT